MSRARAWLAVRAGAVPPELEALMESAVDDVLDDELPLSQSFAEAARICLRRSLRNCDQRTAALPLLAADALMTYACQAAAEEGTAALAALALSNSPDRLARLLPARSHA